MRFLTNEQARQGRERDDGTLACGRQAESPLKRFKTVHYHTRTDRSQKAGDFFLLHGPSQPQISHLNM